MADKSHGEEGSELVTLAQAERAFQESMQLLGMARDELRVRVDRGEVPDSTDIRAMCRSLDEAWRATQKERDRVAEHRRKYGEAVGGDLDLGAARAAVCRQLDRIARSLQAG